MYKSSRRKFIKKAIGAAVVTASIPSLLQAKGKKQIIDLQRALPQKTVGANDQVNVAVIGMGIDRKSVV